VATVQAQFHPIDTNSIVHSVHLKSSAYDFLSPKLVVWWRWRCLFLPIRRPPLFSRMFHKISWCRLPVCDDAYSYIRLLFRSIMGKRRYNAKVHNSHFNHACAVETSYHFHKTVLFTLSTTFSKYTKSGWVLNWINPLLFSACCLRVIAPRS
jgi:hypothetical protein